MIRVLHIQASPRGPRSKSQEVAEHYINALRLKEPVELDLLDVWKEDLPAFDGPVLEAKYAGLSGIPLDAMQEVAWAAVAALGARFRTVDEIVISTPMWNFGIPYRLKHLIDLVTQKDVTFTFDDSGFGGMLRKQRAVIVSARGLSYIDGTPMSADNLDYQKSYLVTWLTFLGITNIKTITVEKTLLGPEESEAALATAIAEATALAN